MRRRLLLMLIASGAVLASPAAPAGKPEDGPAAGTGSPKSSRTVAIRYEVGVDPIPAGSRRIDVWIPYPQDGPGQKMRDIVTTLPAGFTGEIVHDTRYGNRALHVWAAPPASGLTLRMEATVTRQELGGRRPTGETDASFDRAAFASELRPDLLGPLLPEVVRMAREATRGRTTLLDRARGIYEKVLAGMRYDKSGEGWGRGDLTWVCDARRGNCTDFHSLFAAMARSEGIPVRFELGLGLPPRGQEGRVAGYHCWAWFFLPGEGWVPVDISEAWKHPERRDYFFGSLDPDRVALTVGRDIVFPGMSGPPVNLFFAPYIEIDGASFKGATLTTSFTDLDPA